METSLRLVLILIGVIIVVGIIWDSRRSRLDKRSTEKKKPFNFSFGKKENTDFESEHLENEEPSLDEVVMVKSSNHTHYENQTATKKAAFTNTNTTTANTSKASNKANDIIVLNILAAEPNIFVGRQLAEALNKVDMFYGEMKIFHRYKNSDGSGEQLFSLVSSIEPGIFELSTLETYRTPGVTLFFTLDNTGKSAATFELMLTTAKQLAQLLGGELRDDRRRPFTNEVLEDYRNRINMLAFDIRTIKALNI